MTKVHPAALMTMALMTALAAASAVFMGRAAPTANAGETHAAVTFRDGHDTDPRDRGRPVVLIASALGVPPEVFREAFTHVTPAPAGMRPTPQQERVNKAALLAALARYGVTNERLDEVSDYYRYNRSHGELWPVPPAIAYAQIKAGRVVGFVVTSGGSAYTSPPKVTVAGFPDAAGEVHLEWSRDFTKNGAVASIALPGAGKPA